MDKTSGEKHEQPRIIVTYLTTQKIVIMYTQAMKTYVHLNTVCLPQCKGKDSTDVNQMH